MDWKTEGRVLWVRVAQHLQVAKERKLRVATGLLSAVAGIALAVAAATPWERYLGVFIGLMGLVQIGEAIHAEKNRQDWEAWDNTPEAERARLRMGLMPRPSLRERYRWWREQGRS